MRIRAFASTVASLTLIAAGLFASAPAHAAPPVQQETFEGTFNWELCDGDYAVTTTFRDMVTLRDAPPSTDGQFFKLSIRYEFTDTVTNPETGDVITVDGNGVFIEIQPRALGDGIFEYVGNEAGHYTYRDSEGNVILRESGSIAVKYTFDTANDSAPGGETLSADLIRVAGPHPTFPEHCEFLSEALPS